MLATTAIPPEKDNEAWLYDSPSYWAEHDFQIPRIIDFRSSLVNSRFKSHIKEKSRFLELSREIGMASQPVDVEISREDMPLWVPMQNWKKQG